MAATVEFPQPRCGFEELAVLSMHISHKYSQKKGASGAISGLLEHVASKGVRVDIVCGDLNAARCRGVSNV